MARGYETLNDGKFCVQYKPLSAEKQQKTSHHAFAYGLSYVPQGWDIVQQKSSEKRWGNGGWQPFTWQPDDKPQSRLQPLLMAQ